MIGFYDRCVRRARFLFSRTRWVSRLLDLSQHESVTGHQKRQPGVVLLQIDGLSRSRLEQALKAGYMPHLSRRIDVEQLDITSFYSGIPSATPAVQAELHYGLCGAVPSFYWYDRKTQQRRRMYSATAAQQTAKELEQEGGEPLLKGGASYSNVYAAGAGHAVFCSETLDRPHLWRIFHPLRLTLVGFLHGFTFLRLLVLLGLESLVAVKDLFHGMLTRHNWRRELKFILARLGITVLMREIIRFSVKTDVHRGVPIIHANLLGYDEHAHRRGPDSRFAMWTLRGIDDVIKDITRAAERSRARGYHVILFSDHGQERVRSYMDFYGENLSKAVLSVLQNDGYAASVDEPDSGILTEREGFLYERALHLLRFISRGFHDKTYAGFESDEAILCAMGPFAHLYMRASTPLTNAERRELAQKLVTQACVPTVFYKDSEAEVLAVTSDGCFSFSNNPEQVLGSNHPFLKDVTEDLIRVVRSTRAGDFVLSGYLREGTPFSFPSENGAHGGPGPEETHGFLLLPHRPAPSGQWPAGHWRARQLREWCFAVLQNREWKHPATSSRGGRHPRAPEPDQEHSLRVVTYNIHSCRGMDDQVDVERIGHLLGHLHADMIGLQEVECQTKSAHGKDQLALLAEQLGMHAHFLPLMQRDGGSYGIGLLAHHAFEMVQVKRYAIHMDAANASSSEDRGLIHVRFPSHSGHIHFVNTHLGLSGEERREQVDELTGEDIVGGLRGDDTLVVVGDFNMTKTFSTYRKLTQHLVDVQAVDTHNKTRGTFFSRHPLFRIDHVFVSRHCEVRQARVLNNQLTRRASDHLPLVVDLRVKHKD